MTLHAQTYIIFFYLKIGNQTKLSLFEIELEFVISRVALLTSSINDMIFFVKQENRNYFLLKHSSLQLLFCILFFIYRNRTSIWIAMHV